MTKKVPKSPAQPDRRPLNVSKIDRNLWERFKQRAKDKGLALWLYHEQTLREKLERDKE